ncbi:hypothetical protein [Parapedobacter pyrenivorans]|uniref:hypothetical protein n=1 Tax=Parapedobacter pyrenivorans TaxID=1305674 RepID=UPI0033415F31
MKNVNTGFRVLITAKFTHNLVKTSFNKSAMKNLFIIFAFGFLLIGCSKDESKVIENDNFETLYGGRPYVGTARSIRSQQNVADYTWNGEGRVAVIESNNDSISVVFMADFDDEGEINLKFRGKMHGSELRLEAEGSDNYFVISQEEIEGQFENAGQSMAFDGVFQRGKVDLNVNVLFKQTNGAFAAGSTLNLQLNTSREIPTEGDNGPGCNMRLVPIWGPAGMTMGMVPDC